MTGSVNSLDTIKNKIISEAREYEKGLLEKAEKEALKTAAQYAEKADNASAHIISAAAANAESVVSAAESSQGMRARNGLLAVKVELIEKAFDRAAEEIAKLPKDEYLSLFAKYLVSAAKTLNTDSHAKLFVCKKSPVTAEELLNHAGQFANSDLIKPCGTNEKDDSGFCLENGDITIDCTAKTVIGAIKATAETSVAKILFAEN